jgi:hypothetical protein
MKERKIVISCLFVVYYHPIIQWKNGPVFVKFKEPRNQFRQVGNRFLGSLKGLQIRAQGAVGIGIGV